MKTFILILTTVLAQTSWAQVPTEPDEIDARANAKDSVLQDPSAQPQLTISRIIPQREVALTGVGDLIRGGLFVDAFETVFPRYSRLLKKHPEWFDLLQIHRDRYQPVAENGPTLVNADFEFEGISDKKFGYCWGFSTLLRDFITVAFFDPTQARLAQPEDYEDLIDRVTRGKPTVIPGFSNLREMTLVPEIELLMKLKAMQLWKKGAIHLSSIGLYLKTAKPMDHDSAMNLVDDLEARLARGELPKIIFSSRVAAGKLVKLSKYIHVVLVNGIQRTADGGARIRIWDVNFFAESLAKKPKFIEVTSDGKLVYEPWYEPGKKYEAESRFISRLSYAPENDRETAHFIRQLKKFCDREENASWCAPASPSL